MGVGSRFVASLEAGAPKRHKEAVVKAGYHDTVRTIIFTGRPLRVIKSPYIMDWEDNRQDDIKKMTSKGQIPVIHEMEQAIKKGEDIPIKKKMEMMPMLIGSVAGAIEDIKPAAEIMDEMVGTAIKVLRELQNTIVAAKM